ncbi:MAG: hypothetical protein D6679_01650 [Candidatus Hydrogenedentota bacterium]|nr:MAG: hypothetical protein D6679_01650 [Candidatus Hydrogenedentota bacterium]
MNKARLVDHVREKTGLPREAAKKAVEKFIDTIKDSLRRGEEVHIVGFGTFKVVNRRPRRGRNPRSGEVIQVQAKRAVRFLPGKDFRQRIAASRPLEEEPNDSAPKD